MSVRPTRRGYAVIVGTAVALLAGALFGPRALDAVVLSGIVALIAAAVQVHRTPTPRLDRTLPPADVPETARAVEVALDGNRTSPATVRDRLPAGVDAAGSDASTGAADREAVVDVAIGGDAATYEVVPTRRGKHVIGPATVAVTDVLGLLERSISVDATDTLVVFPRLTELPMAVRADLRAAYQSREATQREEFETLREYVRGDALRDIHWKSSARHSELMVMEFTDSADPDRLTVAAGVAGEATAGERAEPSTAADGKPRDTADDTEARAAETMAEAAATVCLSLVRDGVSVTLTTPSGRVEAAPGRFRAALGHLAVADGGPVPTRDADVVIAASADAASVRFDGREHRIEGGTGTAETATLGSQAGRVAGAGSVGSEPVGSDSVESESFAADGAERGSAGVGGASAESAESAESDEGEAANHPDAPNREGSG